MRLDLVNFRGVRASAGSSREPSRGMARGRRSRSHRRARCEERPVVARHRRAATSRAHLIRRTGARSTAKSCRCACCATVRCSRSRRCLLSAAADADAWSSQTPCGVCAAPGEPRSCCSPISRGLLREKTARTCLPEAVAQAAAQFWQALPRCKSLSDPEMLADCRSCAPALFSRRSWRQAPPRTAGAGANDLKALLCRSTSRCARPAPDPTRRAPTPFDVDANAAQLAARSRR